MIIFWKRLSKKIMLKKPIFLKTFFFLILCSIAACDHNDKNISNSAESEQPKQAVRFNGKFLSPIIKIKGNYGEQTLIQIYPSPGTTRLTPWRLLRNYPLGFLDLQRLQPDGSYISLPVSPAFRVNAYPILIMPYANKLYILVYDVVRNVPSGRQLNVLEPGYDLYETDDNIKKPLKLVKQGIELGGIDTLVYGRAKNNQVDLCGINKCVSITTKGDLKKWELSALDKYEFIEILYLNNNAYALIRLKHDDRTDGALTAEDAKIMLAKITPTNTTIQTIDNESGIPYALYSTDGKKINWHYAKTPEELRKLFVYELNRMPHQGWMDFGQNNLEGRVAWSQVYYLDGLISLLDNKSSLNYFADHNLKRSIRSAVIEELNLIAQLNKFHYPNFSVKRYSLEREPLLFALHLGRIVNLFANAKKADLDNDQILSRTIPTICERMISLQETTEQKIKNLSDNHESTHLQYRKGYPFWADGVNVPYNYVSGYVQGLLTACISQTKLSNPINLLKPLMLEVNNQNNTWRYWSGLGDKGWKTVDQVSLNTPEWGGNKGAQAHITYRSMDAAALLTLYRLQKSAVPASIITHLRQLVREGWLLPQVNNELSLLGKPEVLNKFAARRYARSTSVWELASQPWALESLARKNQSD